MAGKTQGSAQTRGAAGAGAEILRIERGQAGVGIKGDPAHGDVEDGEQAEHVAEGGPLLGGGAGQAFARQHEAAGAALKGPLHHQLRLQLQAAATPQFDRLQVVADVKAIAIFFIGIPGKSCFLFANGGVGDGR